MQCKINVFSLSLSLLPVVELLQSTMKQDQTQHVRDIHSQSDPTPHHPPVSYSWYEYGGFPGDRSHPVYQCLSLGQNDQTSSKHCLCCGREKGCG